MGLNRTSDSLSSCDPNNYSNLYDIRKPSMVRKEPLSATQPIHKDTIEISRDKLKQEALNRLRHSSSIVSAQSSFMRIGKYLFLAIAFPPYLMVYGLPKWIVIEGIPAIFSMLIWTWKKVQIKTKKPLEVIQQKVRLMIQFMQRIGYGFIQPVIRLALEVRNTLHRMQYRINQFFEQFKSQIRTAIHWPGLKVTEQVKRLQKKLKQIKERIRQYTQDMTLKLQENVQWVKQLLPLTMDWGQMQLRRLQQQIISLGKKGELRFQKSQNLAQQATNWISKQFQAGAERFKHRLKPVLNFYRQQLQPKWSQFKTICNNQWQQTKDFFNQKHQKTLAFLNQKQGKLKHLSHHHLFQYLVTQTWLQPWLKKWLMHPFIQDIFLKGFKAYIFFAKQILSILILLMRSVHQSTQFIFKACYGMRSYLNVAVQKILYAWKISQTTCQRLTRLALYYFLVFVMMLGILLVWGMELLKNISLSLTKKFILKAR